MSFAWPAEGSVYYQQAGTADPSARVQIIQQPVQQQPTTIIQQIPGAFTPLSHPIRAGRAKEDLIELMMIQNAQMHQVIMNNMTMSAMSAFGYYAEPLPPPAPKVKIVPLEIENDEPEVVYHHHYQPYPGHYPPLPQWQPHQEPAVRHVNMELQPISPRKYADHPAVPPPPPPSATGTVGADVPPASEYYDHTEGRL